MRGHIILQETLDTKHSSIKDDGKYDRKSVKSEGLIRRGSGILRRPSLGVEPVSPAATSADRSVVSSVSCLMYCVICVMSDCLSHLPWSMMSLRLKRRVSSSGKSQNKIQTQYQLFQVEKLLFAQFNFIFEGSLKRTISTSSGLRRGSMSRFVSQQNMNI